MSTQSIPANAARVVDYVISGLNVRSQVELPSAIRAETPHSTPEVIIRLGEVPEALPSPGRKGHDWERTGDDFLLKLPGLMRVRITDGSTITAHLEDGAKASDTVLFLLGTCFAVLLHQRARVVLHASAVAVGEGAMLFCGQSGAGKSTMAAMLSQRGFPLLNDDVCNLSLRPDGEYAVYPDGRMLKLWTGSLDHLQWNGDDSARVREDAEKFYMAPPHVDLTPRLVSGVYILQAGDGDASLERLSAADAMAELMRNAYRTALVHAQEMAPAYFGAAVSIQRRAGVYRLSRPMDFSRAGEALDLLAAHWSKLR